jgi:hypothetical protein
MAAGVSTYAANGWLNTIKSTGTSFNVAGGVFTQLHTTTGPGGAGTSNISSTTTRPAIIFTVTATGQLTNLTTSQPSWSGWAGTNGEVVTYVSFWDTALGPNGNFLWSSSLSASKTINTGDTFTLTAATLTITVAS